MPTFETPEPIDAHIEVGSGRFVINAADRTDTTVDVIPQDPGRDADVQAAEQIRVEYAAGRLSVRAPRNTLRSLIGRPGMADVTIALPAGSRVDVNAASGDIRCEGALGRSTFRTAAGSVRLDRAAGTRVRTSTGNVAVGRSSEHTDVATSTGKIWIGAAEGSVVAKTSNGDITVGEAGGDLRLTTANGDITIDRALATVAAKTAYGSIRVGEVARGTVHLETNFGELELGIAEGTAAWLDADSKHGAVRSELQAVDNPHPGDQRVEVRARTGFGDIVVHRRPS
ncbi:hypothetical protein Acsp03_53850 [Actinomadura sp. NBRC 104412]|uniref:DUF4097 family beta strand repeat-containing protein n=1 Tax=Actinomadura sp. NBRC 104412 TaxID=3032203 RepID=UPI0024A00E74|nr:DUF4097 family beta strand repeat-containing protein [Actinomadura sp. NBRC 104412]GLZ07919.1 hypothetical protein Acsp03_53850 [Actinomadura sp. NBRC 104412]